MAEKQEISPRGGEGREVPAPPKEVTGMRGFFGNTARKVFLALGLTAGVAGLSGCSSGAKHDPPVPPTPGVPEKKEWQEVELTIVGRTHVHVRGRYYLKTIIDGKDAVVWELPEGDTPIVMQNNQSRVPGKIRLDKKALDLWGQIYYPATDGGKDWEEGIKAAEKKEWQDVEYAIVGSTHVHVDGRYYLKTIHDRKEMVWELPKGDVPASVETPSQTRGSMHVDGERLKLLGKVYSITVDGGAAWERGREETEKKGRAMEPLIPKGQMRRELHNVHAEYQDGILRIVVGEVQYSFSYTGGVPQKNLVNGLVVLPRAIAGQFPGGVLLELPIPLGVDRWGRSLFGGKTTWRLEKSEPVLPSR